MEGSVELVDGMTFRAAAESGHTLVLDAAPEVGGREQGPRPMELLLLGLGGCTGMDVISILRKMRQEVTAYQVRLHADRAQEHPKVFTSIVVEHVVHGRAVDPASVRRAIELSATRYCSASAMLGAVARIEHRYRVLDDGTGAETGGALPAAHV